MVTVDADGDRDADLPAPCILPRPPSDEDRISQHCLPQEHIELPLIAPALPTDKGFVSAAKELAISGGSRARAMSLNVADSAKVLSRTAWTTVLDDWKMAYEASFDLITLWLCPPCFKALDEKDQHNHAIILWNPIFWAMHLPLVICILSGKWLHSLWGQGGRVRHDESMEENRVRTHWIYCLDGPIASLCLLDMVDVLLDVPMYSQRKFQASFLSWCMTLTVTCGYVLGNSYFLFVMRRRSLVGVRLVIICQTVFAIGLLNMLVAGLFRNKESGRYGNFFFSTWLELVSWSARLTMVIFMLAAAFVYSKL
mmetsp:Transcript_36842/g.97412  ORF Transcript_36842/g.97412 Transcript_36842/m.97412 type:complete len:311 (-) Transcript_36842:902-1834(-)